MCVQKLEEQEQEEDADPTFDVGVEEACERIIDESNGESIWGFSASPAAPGERLKEGRSCCNIKGRRAACFC